MEIALNPALTMCQGRHVGKIWFEKRYGGSKIDLKKLIFLL